MTTHKQSSEPPASLPVKMVPIAGLKPHPRNYRKHPPEQLAHIVASLEEHGFYRNVVLARDGTILAGHGVVEACRLKGLPEVLAMQLDLAPSDKRALKIVAADNEIARGADNDDRALSVILREIMEEGGGPQALLGTGFDASQLAALVYVTRPASEIVDVDAAAHWAGMPDFDAGAPIHALVVQFRDAAAREQFVRDKDLSVTDRKGRTWSTWWPRRPRDDLSSVRWVEGNGSHLLPRYPVFIPTRGRVARQLTARMFDAAGVPFRLVVEDAEANAHRKNWGDERVLVLPESNRGLVYSRNWIRDHAMREGHARHWQFDDDIRRMVRVHKGRRVTCPANVPLVVAEDFTERYANVRLTSFNSQFFVVSAAGFSWNNRPPFELNSRCYTVFLVDNAMPHRWRGRYNEDTDMSLQVLAGGDCTLLLNAFCIDTPTTMAASGGQMVSPTGSYQGDGRLHMARELERRWPYVVSTIRRYHRPQHSVRHLWKAFDTPLVRSGTPPLVREYPMRLEVVRTPRNPEMLDFVRSVS